jgi:hypothetical protein
MGTGMKGTLAIGLENLNAQGKQPLLPQTAIAPTMSLTSQGSFGVAGCRYHIIVFGNTTTGSITLTGKDVNGGALVETISNIPVPSPAGQHPLVNDFEWGTTNVFSSINASGITTTGLANGFIIILGCQAPKILVPSTWDADETYQQYSPKEHRGLIYLDTNIQQGVKKVDWQLQQSLYTENSLYVPYASISAAPTITTIPATPTVLKAATAVSTGPFGLTTQPTGPGQILQVIITASAAVGTIVIVGTNSLNQATTETIVANGNGSNGNGTYYSSNSYSAVGATGISFTGLTGGSAAFGGAFALDYVFTPSDSIYTLCAEDYTGTDSSILPLLVATDLEINQDVQKQVDITLKGFAQDLIHIGDRTTQNMVLSRVLQLGQPLDKPLTGWQSLIFIDPVPGVGGTPGATLYGDLNTLKLILTLPADPEYNATNLQTMTTFFRDQISGSFTMSINFKNLLQYEQFRQNGIQVFQIKYLGPILGTNAGALVQKAWIITVAAKYKAIKRKRDKKVSADIDATMQYEPSLGYGVKFEIITTQAPTLPN